MLITCFAAIGTALPQSGRFPISTSCAGWCPGEMMCTMELGPDGQPTQCQVQNQRCASTSMCKAFVAQRLEAQAVEKRSPEESKSLDDKDDNPNDRPRFVPGHMGHGPVVPPGSGGLPGWIPWAGHGPVINQIPRAPAVHKRDDSEKVRGSSDENEASEETEPAHPWRLGHGPVVHPGLPRPAVRPMGY